MMSERPEGLGQGERSENLVKKLREAVILASVAAVSLAVGNALSPGFYEFKILLFQFLLALFVGLSLFSRDAGDREKATAVEVCVFLFLFLHFLSLHVSHRMNPQIVLSCRVVFVVLCYVGFFFLISRLQEALGSLYQGVSS